MRTLRAPAQMRLAGASLTALFLACAANPAFVARDAPLSSDLDSVLLLAANFDNASERLFASGSEILGSNLDRYLSERGYAVHTVRLSSVLTYWAESLEAVGGITSAEGNKLDEDRYEEARREVARRALVEHSADAVIMPTLLMRMGQVSGRRLRWDGVVKDIPVDMNQTNIGVTGMRGKAAGTSLRISVYDRRPVKIFERIVGLEPLNSFKAHKTHMEVRVRQDLFEDEDVLKQGVALAFEPWLAGPGALSE